MAIFDKAKQLRDQASQKAGALAEQAAQKAAEVRADVNERAAEVRAEVSEKAAEVRAEVAEKAAGVKESVASVAADAKDASIARVRETIADFNEALPIIRQAGYRVTGVDIALGLPPKISASVTVSDDVTAEHVEAVLAQHKDKKLTTLIVKSLFQAWRLQNSVSIVGMKARGMSIELGLIPNVGIKFVAIDPPPGAAAGALPAVSPSQPAEPTPGQE